MIVAITEFVVLRSIPTTRAMTDPPSMAPWSATNFPRYRERAYTRRPAREGEWRTTPLTLCVFFIPVLYVLFAGRGGDVGRVRLRWPTLRRRPNRPGPLTGADGRLGDDEQGNH